jgi:hypothetical protein
MWNDSSRSLVAPDSRIGTTGPGPSHGCRHPKSAAPISRIEIRPPAAIPTKPYGSVFCIENREQIREVL